MSSRLIHLAAAAATLAAAAFSAPAQAGVSWSIGINAPIAPGVHVGTVIGGGRPMVGVGIAPVYAPAPVVYAPPPVYVPPPMYAPAPVVYEPAYEPAYAPAVIAPPPVYVGGYYRGYHRHPAYYPRPVYYRPPVVRPPVMARPVGGAVMSRPVYGNGHGGYGPVAQR